MTTVAHENGLGQGETAVITHINLSQIDDAWESLCEAGRLMVDANDNNRWALGDLATRVEKHYGENTLADFASQIKMFEKTLSNYRTVSMFYEISLRGEFPALSWSHYREAMRLGNVNHAMELLALVQDQNLSIREMSRIIRERLGKPEPTGKVTEFEATLLDWEPDVIVLQTTIGAGDLVKGKAYIYRVFEVSDE